MCKGTPWDKVIGKNSLHENLEILMKVADAVAFAHSRGVVHRDLKPENVMLGDFGEVLVMDWGLAPTLVAQSAGINVAMGGTPGYMAPEMAMGPIDAIGFHSDIYLLGAILYEIVTGQRPHTGKTIMSCLMAAAKTKSCPTEKTGELMDIALKAMATKPHDRYPTVRDFQNAVRAYQSHIESIALGARAQDDLEARPQDGQVRHVCPGLFAYQEAYTLWDGNTKAKSGIVECGPGLCRKCRIRKADFDLGLSLLKTEEPAHAPVIERLTRGRNERDRAAPPAGRSPRGRRPGGRDLHHRHGASIIIERSRRDAVNPRHLRKSSARRPKTPRRRPISSVKRPSKTRPRPSGRKASPSARRSSHKRMKRKQYNKRWRPIASGSWPKRPRSWKSTKATSPRSAWRPRRFRKTLLIMHWP